MDWYLLKTRSNPWKLSRQGVEGYNQSCVHREVQDFAHLGFTTYLE